MSQKIKNDAEGAELKNQVNVTTIEQNLQASNGIPPYKLAAMFKLADKVLNQLVNVPAWVMTYSDIEYILSMLLDAVKKARANS